MFLRYLNVGFINTSVHFFVFYLLIKFDVEQDFSNLLSFFTATSIGYFLNRKFTFGSNQSNVRYFWYVFFMGGVSYFVGFVNKMLNFQPIYSLLIFSLLSLFVGYNFSKFIFKGKNNAY